MKILILLFLLATLAFSKVYYSRVEPYEVRDIASNVSGQVLFTDENMIGRKLSKKPFITIDDELNRDELREFYDVVNSENSYLATIKEINSLKTTVADLELRKKQLIRTIKDKQINAAGFVLYSIKVEPENVVNIGTPLATVADVSRAKLTVYLDEDDILGIDKKVVYIHNKKTNYKVSRMSKIADSKNISKYKAQIIIKSPKIFSNLVQIELKEKQNAK